MNDQPTNSASLQRRRSNKGLQAAGNPTRQALLELLRDKPQTVTELAQRLPITRPAVSQHLRVLSEAGLVRAAAAGTNHIYALEPQALAALGAYLADLSAGTLADIDEGAAHRALATPEETGRRCRQEARQHRKAAVDAEVAQRQREIGALLDRHLPVLREHAAVFGTLTALIEELGEMVRSRNAELEQEAGDLAQRLAALSDHAEQTAALQARLDHLQTTAAQVSADLAAARDALAQARTQTATAAAPARTEQTRRENAERDAAATQEAEQAAARAPSMQAAADHARTQAEQARLDAHTARAQTAPSASSWTGPNAT